MAELNTCLLLQNTRIKSSGWKHAFSDMKKSNGQMVVPKLTPHRSTLAWEPNLPEVRRSFVINPLSHHMFPVSLSAVHLSIVVIFTVIA